MESRELGVAKSAARAGGEVVSRYYHDGTIMRSKDVANLVSDADVDAESAIVAVIRAAFPDHEVLGEEGHAGDVRAEHLWIIDPLDGTSNFAHRVPQFAVSVAYYHHGAAECGVVLNPIRDDWYVAARGRGALLNGASVQVGEQATLDEILVGVGFYYDRGEMLDGTLAAIGDLKRDHHIHGIRRFGAASLDLCMVGLGWLGAYFEYTLSPWDFAAGRLFVEEAGGKVTTTLGLPLPLAKSSILASNGRVHDAMLDVIRPHNPTGPGYES